MARPTTGPRYSDVAASNGDDCDGLDLLTFMLLRKLGFSQNEIFRSIVVERDSGQHHMVTLWFEAGDKTNPWLLDPTGVVTDRLVRLSDVPTWSPIEIFDEARHYRVEESPRAGCRSRALSPRYFRAHAAGRRATRSALSPAAHARRRARPRVSGLDAARRDVSRADARAARRSARRHRDAVDVVAARQSDRADADRDLADARPAAARAPDALGRDPLRAHRAERARLGAHARARGGRDARSEPGRARAGRSSRACPIGSRRCARGFAAGRLDRRFERACERRQRALERLASLDPGDLDAGELARGPLDDRTWTEILLPWLGERLYLADEAEPDAALRAAVALEQRCAAELGVRLAARRTLATPSQVAYLTVEERIRAVLDGSSEWSELAAIRQERVEQFTKFDVPRVFWGRPRPELEKA